MFTPSLIERHSDADDHIIPEHTEEIPMARTVRKAATAVADKPAAKTTRTRAKAKSAPEPEVIEDEVDELEDEEIDEADDEVDEEPAPAPVKKTARKAKAKPAPVVEEDDDELEDVDDDDAEEVEEKPTKKKAAAKAPAKAKIEFGTQWLAEYINGQAGTSLTAYQLRDLIRRLARKGELEREIGTDRSRYEFSGPKDPQVKAILAAVKRGDAEKAKGEKLDNLKKAREAKAAKKTKKVEEVVEEIEDDELEDDDLEDLDDE